MKKMISILIAVLFSTTVFASEIKRTVLDGPEPNGDGQAVDSSNYESGVTVLGAGKQKPYCEICEKRKLLLSQNKDNVYLTGSKIKPVNPPQIPQIQDGVGK